MSTNKHDSAFVREVDEAERGVDEILGRAIESAACVRFGTNGNCHLDSDLELKHWRKKKVR
jgi:hypothetical protein